MLLGRSIEIDCVLAVPIQISCLLPLGHKIDEIDNLNNFNVSLHLCTRHQPQPDIEDDPKESVASNNKRKQFRILFSAAFPYL